MARKTYSYDPKSGRFRDAQGHFISKAKALRSSIARAQYEAAQRPARRPKPTPRPAPRPAPTRKPTPVRAFRYDPKTGRFYDSQGKRISRERGLKSRIARAQFEASLKPKKPTKRRPSRPRKHKVMISEQAKARGQFTVENVQSIGLSDLAEMLLTQVGAGFERFRFWYKMKKRTTAYKKGIGSTMPLHYSVVVGKSPNYQHALDFVSGKRGWIYGKIFMYWMSKR